MITTFKQLLECFDRSMGNLKRINVCKDFELHECISVLEGTPENIARLENLMVENADYIDRETISVYFQKQDKNSIPKEKKAMNYAEILKSELIQKVREYSTKESLIDKSLFRAEIIEKDFGSFGIVFYPQSAYEGSRLVCNVYRLDEYNGIVEIYDDNNGDGFCHGNDPELDGTFQIFWSEYQERVYTKWALRIIYAEEIMDGDETKINLDNVCFSTWLSEKLKDEEYQLIYHGNGK